MSDRERRVGRYVLHDEIGRGGAAVVHLGRLVGPVGFSRMLAIKRLRDEHARDAELVGRFVDEARLSACVRHPNVAATLDVVVSDGEVLVVMEYVHGASLSKLLQARHARPSHAVAVTIAAQLLHGLHAAHEAISPAGEPLDLVHRDVSPHNAVVGTDGVTRVVDFGVARATWRLEKTRDGLPRGKLAYMAPEQLDFERVDRRADIFSASVVLWETLTHQRLFAADDPATTVARVRKAEVEPPSARGADCSPEVDRIVLRGLAARPQDRYSTAREMALALEASVELASPSEVGAWVESAAADMLAARDRTLRAVQQSASADDTSAGNAGLPFLERSYDRSRARDEPTQIEDLPAVKAASAEVGPAPRKKAHRRWGALSLALVVGLAAAWVALRHRSQQQVPAETERGSTMTSSAVASVRPPPVVSAAPAKAAETAEGTPEPGPSAKPAAARASPARPRHQGSATRPASCDPPYFVGPDGVRRFRPECI